ncbi:MAG: hypothetical protein LBD45_07610 [Bacteroidales bacterium]|jgi:hypothetical protein|nr:hypothetical protein [Bacteroidales bacterium]
MIIPLSHYPANLGKWDNGILGRRKKQIFFLWEQWMSLLKKKVLKQATQTTLATQKFNNNVASAANAGKKQTFFL